jgi:hypothetical protein
MVLWWCELMKRGGTKRNNLHHHSTTEMPDYPRKIKFFC